MRLHYQSYGVETSEDYTTFPSARSQYDRFFDFQSSDSRIGPNMKHFNWFIFAQLHDKSFIEFESCHQEMRLKMKKMRFTNFVLRTVDAPTLDRHPNVVRRVMPPRSALVRTTQLVPELTSLGWLYVLRCTFVRLRTEATCCGRRFGKRCESPRESRLVKTTHYSATHRLPIQQWCSPFSLT